MNCPNCNYPNAEQYRFCIHCGTDLHPEAGEPVFDHTPPKKGSHWVPIMILVILSAIGIGLFFATSGRQEATVLDPKTPWFTISGGELYFDERLYTGGSEITVPDTVNGEPVLALSDFCFAACTDITTVHLPDTLESIGHFAFADCTSLRGILLPDSVIYIGEMAFSNCTALEAIVIPKGMEQIDLDAFDECNKLYYIFYFGSYDSWTQIYSEFINPYTGVYCEDGSFYQGGNPNG